MVGWLSKFFNPVPSYIQLNGVTLFSVNVFYHINQMPARNGTDAELAKQEREFQIGSVGFSDSLGILCASLIAMPTELELCKAQVRRGEMLCAAV